MHRFIFHSDTFGKMLAGMICICCLMSGCRMQARTEALASKEGYLITIHDNATDKDTRWARYLYDHLRNRTDDDEVVAFGVSDKDMWRIIIQIDPTVREGFRITRKGDDIRLTAADDKKMLWLQYQLMKNISQKDPRIDGSELPPALIHLNDTSGNFAFEYQSIYSPVGLNADYTGIAGLDNLDDSWGIWGHNLRKVLGSNAEKVYATIDGKKNPAQLCFSSEEMYSLIQNYIIDNYGEKGNIRFVIAPDDTPFACTCPACTAVGNTARNATPAVTGLIDRLARNFPDHLFFTISYLSTQKPADKALPSNAGIIVSAIDYPLRFTHANTPEGKKFAQRLKQWNKVTNNIYIWDYINNFDDYLTPFPVLKIAQQRLKFFQSQGASGIFLNGSGYSYSSFEDVKTFVLSALLINPDLSVDALVRQFLNQEYPTAKKWLYDYYTDLENKVESERKQLGLYAGIRESESAFLDPERFIRFYDEIGNFVNASKGVERKKLHQLQTALSFTRLETGRNHSMDAYGYAKQDGKTIRPLPQAQEWMERLNEYKAFPAMTAYNESGDQISSYLEEWKHHIWVSDISGNLLSGITPSVVPSWEDKDINLSLLTDGTHGLPGNYHFGWVIIPKHECRIDLPVKDLKTSGTLRLSFLQLDRHRIYAPQKMELLKDGALYKTVDIKPETVDEKGKMIKVSIPIGLNETKQLSIKLTCPQKPGAQIAVDEIALIP